MEAAPGGSRWCWRCTGCTLANRANAVLLKRLAPLALGQCHLTVGCLFQPVWNSRSSRPPEWGIRLAMPFYTRRRPNPDVARRGILRAEVLRWFTRPGGEGQSFDLLPDLHRITCPTLVVGGEDDPMTPIESQADIAAALRPGIVRFERFAGCGHGVVADAEDRALPLFRSFINEETS